MPIVADLKTVLKELHNQTKQILISAAGTVDSNGTLTHPNFIKYGKCFVWLLGFGRLEYDVDISKPNM